MALEYTTEIAGERYGADERAQYEVTINDGEITIRDRLYRKEVSMTRKDWKEMCAELDAYDAAKAALSAR